MKFLCCSSTMPFALTMWHTGYCEAFITSTHHANNSSQRWRFATPGFDMVQACDTLQCHQQRIAGQGTWALRVAS